MRLIKTICLLFGMVALLGACTHSSSKPTSAIALHGCGPSNTPLVTAASQPPTPTDAGTLASKDDVHDGYSVGRDQWAAIVPDECAPLPPASEIAGLCGSLYDRLPSTGPALDSRTKWVTGCSKGVTDGWRSYH